MKKLSSKNESIESVEELFEGNKNSVKYLYDGKLSNVYRSFCSDAFNPYWTRRDKVKLYDYLKALFDIQNYVLCERTKYFGTGNMPYDELFDEAIEHFKESQIHQYVFHRLFESHLLW